MMKHKRLNELEAGETPDNTYVSMKDDEVLTQVSSNPNNNTNKKEVNNSNDIFSKSPAPSYKSESAFGPSYIRLWQLAVAFCFVVVVILIIVLGVLQSHRYDQLLATIGNSNGLANTPVFSGKKVTETSCLEHFNNGIKRDGYQFITTQASNGLPVEVYCDMTTNGGGWTLVASIHEDNINRKCDSHDMWSRYVEKEEAEHSDAGNWVNEHTFGSAKASTSNDYKSPAYLSINASNVMVWHSPRDAHILDSTKASDLQYYTTNNFLQENGGNLYSLYNNYHDLSIHKDYLLEQVNTIADKIVGKGGEISKAVTNFHKYEYDGNFDYRIENGNGMFNRGGNQVSPKSDRCYGYLDYGENKTCDEGSAVFTSRKSSPFLALALFMNEFNDDDEQFGFRVRHNRPRASDDDLKTFSGNITKGNFFLQYYSNNIYGNSTLYPSISEMHFVVTNLNEWNSTQPERFGQSYSYHSTSLNYYNGEVTSTSGKNLVAGYMLLSRTDGKYVPETEFRAVGNIILNEIAVFNKFVEIDPSLAVPVSYAKGSNEKVVKMSPPQFKGLYEPGYLQFSPRNAFGYPNAFCPGIKVSTLHPEFLCVGGIASDDTDTYSTCGDFAGWNGVSSDRTRPNPKIPKGWAHSDDDIKRVIMMFYR